jgi:tRNA 2-thiouridine synthesizing protein D
MSEPRKSGAFLFMSSFTLLVTSAPFSRQSSGSAYAFCSAAIELGHQIQSIFFYQDGVINSNAYVTNHSDEINMMSQWRGLAEKHNLALN